MRITLLRTTFIYSLISVFMLGSVQASAALVDNQHLAQSAQVEQQRDAGRDLLAGANAGVGFVLGVILIFILLDLLGATDVFPRI